MQCSRTQLSRNNHTPCRTSSVPLLNQLRTPLPPYEPIIVPRVGCSCCKPGRGVLFVQFPHPSLDGGSVGPAVQRVSPDPGRQGTPGGDVWDVLNELLHLPAVSSKQDL